MSQMTPLPPTALKIHISLETKILLDINGSFVTEHRGAIEIKVSLAIKGWVPQILAMQILQRG